VLEAQCGLLALLTGALISGFTDSSDRNTTMGILRFIYMWYCSDVVTDVAYGTHDMGSISPGDSPYLNLLF